MFELSERKARPAAMRLDPSLGPESVAWSEEVCICRALRGAAFLGLWAFFDAGRLRGVWRASEAFWRSACAWVSFFVKSVHLLSRAIFSAALLRSSRSWLAVRSVLSNSQSLRSASLWAKQEGQTVVSEKPCRARQRWRDSQAFGICSGRKLLPR